MATTRGSGNVPAGSSLRLERQFSVKEAEASNELLTCIEDGDIEELHALVSKLPEGITSTLNTPSLLVKHKLRTPLMAAAATGDFPRFTAVLHAFDRQFPSKLHRDSEMRTQLTTRDRKGMNIVMLAARSSSMAVLGALLTEVTQTEALKSLDMHDHKQMTVLMHAASTGRAPIFQEVHRALRKATGGDDIAFGRHLLLKSADDKTILMHAAASGDSMVLKVVAGACQKSIMPQTLRHMITARDSDGLNLLMHAASCRAPPSALLPAEPILVDPNTSDKKDGDMAVTTTTGSGSPAPDAKSPRAHLRMMTSAAAAATSSGPANDASGDKKSSLEHMIAEDEAEAKKDAVVVPVFKVAVRLVKQMLWKDEVLQQLKAVDLWGRSVLTHALLSGHEMMFEAAYGAVRDDVIDEQVSEMMETNEGEREDTPMIVALAKGDTSMRKLYALRAGQVKKDVDMRSKLSSMDAKIESFIPGKLVVMFQLLLPQIAEGRQLFLLYVLCAIAPIMKLAAGSTADPESKHKGIAPRSNKLSVLLGAPAMFFWGVGTSTVGSRLGWSSSLSATSMAAATLVIPAIDSFFNSRRANHLGDKICCREWCFNWKAYREWRSMRKKTPATQAQNELPTYSTFAAEPETASTSTSQGVEVAPLTEQELPGTTPILTPQELPRESFDLSEEA
eukprot:g17986.t1